MKLAGISGAANTLAGVGSVRQRAGCRRPALTLDSLSDNEKGANLRFLSIPGELRSATCQARGFARF